jgi:diguanylate cyclase (GGDEF)-like protein
MSNTELTAQLEILQRAFVASLPAKISRMEALLQECASAFNTGQAWPAKTIREAHLLTHSLAGSGGTFGCHALGQAAGALEVLLTPLLSADFAINQHAIEQISRGLATIKAASLEPAAQPTEPLPTKLTKAETVRREQFIYLVEDDTALAASLAAQLTHFGYRVRSFASPTEIAPDPASPLPTAIIMDIGFPTGMLAGPAAVKNALQESFHGVPVLFISARGDFEARLEAVRAGGVAYFTKPVDIGALVNALDSFTSQTRPAAFRILLVDDSESISAFYQQVLSAAGMETMVVHDPSKIGGPLAEFSPDLILMDIYMPVCNGIELATLIRQQPNFVGVPIVFLSSETNTNRHMVAMRQGGDDFLCKPIDPARLISVVTNRAERGRILRARMTTDGLTGLLNHSHLKEQLETEIIRSKRYGKPLVFAMIDIDNFKQVNDTWGHAAGDRVLRSLAKLLRQRLRRTDIAGRYGGEEFGLILSDIDAPTALTLLDSIRRDFSALRHANNDKEFNVTFSAGIASFPQHETADSISCAADAALYAAKNTGRNRIVLDGDH